MAVFIPGASAAPRRAKCIQQEWGGGEGEDWGEKRGMERRIILI